MNINASKAKFLGELVKSSKRLVAFLKFPKYFHNDFDFDGMIQIAKNKYTNHGDIVE